MATDVAVHRVYGLLVAAERALPGVPLAPDGAAPDVRVDFSGVWPTEIPLREDPRWTSIDRAADDGNDRAAMTWRLVDGELDYWRVDYAIDGARVTFLFDGTASRVCGEWGSDVGFDDVAGFFIGPVLGRLLCLRGIVCLHSSVVRFPGGAAAFVGAKAAGKSSTALGLAKLGHAIVADDIAALEVRGAEVVALPGYARLRLWKPAIDQFYGSRDGLAKVVSNRNKRYLDLGATGPWRFASEPTPLSAIYVLGARAPGGRATMTPASGARALIALLENRYASELVPADRRSDQLAALAHVARSLPVIETSLPDRMDALPEACAAIVGDFEARSRPGPGAAG